MVVFWSKEMKLSRRVGLGVLFASLLGLSVYQLGCSVIPPMNLKSPELAFSDLSVSDFSFEKVKFVVTVAAQNPNDVDIPLSNMKFDMNLLETAVGTGAALKDINLPKKGSAQVPIEFNISTTQLLGLLKQVNLRDLAKLSYSLKGSANWNNGPFTIPFERKGDLTMLKKYTDRLAPFLTNQVR
jgi:LEA14-like dessication related protein